LLRAGEKSRLPKWHEPPGGRPRASPGRGRAPQRQTCV